LGGCRRERTTRHARWGPAGRPARRYQAVRPARGHQAPLGLGRRGQVWPWTGRRRRRGRAEGRRNSWRLKSLTADLELKTIYTNITSLPLIHGGEGGFWFGLLIPVQL
jgi:hypothetical protein